MKRRGPKTLRMSQPLQTPARAPAAHRPLILSVLITLVLGGIPFALGRYIELNSPDPFDSSAYVYSAKHLLDGARLGVDEVTSAAPGTLLVNVLGVKLFGFNDVGPKIVQMILQTAALVFMFYTLYRFFGSAAAVVSTVVAAVYLSAPLVAKGGNVKEQFMIALMLAAACCFLHGEFTRKRFWLVLCGFFAVQPYYFKPTGLSIIAVIGGYLLLSRLFAKDAKRLFVEMLLFLGGTAAGLLVPASLYLWQRQAENLLWSLPVLMIQFGLVLLLAAAAVYYVICAPGIRLWDRLKRVSGRIYKLGALALIGAIVVGLLMVAAANVYYAQKYNDSTTAIAHDLSDYVRSIPIIEPPVRFFRTCITKLIVASGLKGGYVEQSWKMVPFSDVAQKVLRYYKALCVPILLAILSLAAAGFVTVRHVQKKQPLDMRDRMVWLLAIWWLLDMVFVWISPHSYEQYYLPLCASAAMLAAYAVGRWQKNLATASFKIPWLIAAVVVILLLASLSVPIFIGQRYSPDTGADYTAGGGQRRRGFITALEGIQSGQSYPWEQAGQYISAHSGKEDKIYVWGWFPGIYVAAERMAPIPQAYEANMHFMTPWDLNALVQSITAGFEQNPPKFIVDSRKRHFPFNRPPLELWPVVPPRMIGNDRPRLLDPASAREIEMFDTAYRQFLKDQIEPDEAARYDAMQPLRQFVMSRYRFAAQFGEHMVFERIQ